MSLGSLVVNLTANTAQFNAGMTRAAQAAANGARAVGGSMGNLVKGVLSAEAAMAAAAAAVGAFAVSFEAAGQAIDSEAMIGTAPEKFYQMQHAIASAGDETAGLMGLMAKFGATLTDTTDASKGAGVLITQLGLDFQQLKSMDPTDAFKKVAVALQDIDDPVLRARVGQELLGKAYKDNAPALGAYAENTVVASAVTLEHLQALDGLSDRLGGAQESLKDTTIALMGSLVPSLNASIDALFSTDDQASSLAGTLSSVLNPAIQGTTVLLLAAKTGAETLGASVGYAMRAIHAKASGDQVAFADAGAFYDRKMAEITKKAGESFDGVINATKNAAIAARQAKGDFSDIADAQLRAAKTAEFHAKKQADDAAQTAKRKKQLEEWTGALKAASGGGAPKAAVGSSDVIEFA